MVLFINNSDNSIYAFNTLLSKSDIEKYPDAIWYDGDFSFSHGEEKEDYKKIYKWDGQKPIVEYEQFPEPPQPTQLDRIEGLLAQSVTDIENGAIDRYNLELVKEGVL